MKPSYKELYEEYLICDQERYKLLEENQKLKIDISARETVVDEKQQEIDRLNNILDELEKYIKTEIPEEEFVNSEWYVNILDKLKALKENNK